MPDRIEVKETAQEIERIAAHQKSKAVLKRLAVLQLYKLMTRKGEEDPIVSVSSAVGVKEQTVERWLAVYEKGGLDALLSYGRAGGGVKSKARGRPAAGKASGPKEEADPGRLEGVQEPADTKTPEPSPDEQRHDRALITEQGHGSPRKRSVGSSLKVRYRAGRRAITRWRSAAGAERILSRGPTSEQPERPDRDPITKAEARPPAPISPQPAVKLEPSRGSEWAQPAKRKSKSKVDPSKSPRERKAGRSSLVDQRILVVEQDEMIRAIVRHRLEKFGASVVTVDDGVEAVSLLEVQSFDVAVIAVSLPGLDGFEIVEWVREKDDLDQMSVMMISWPGNEADLVRAFDVGADDYLLKPFAPMELIARLGRLVHSRETGKDAGPANDED